MNSSFTVLHNNLTVLLSLQVCGLQDNFSAKGKVEGKNGFYAKACDARHRSMTGSINVSEHDISSDFYLE
jgi:hypothetical protein